MQKINKLKNKNKPKILITNDDGVEAPGIKVLIELLQPYANLLVIAPDRGQSAMSHAISLHKPLYVSKIKEENGVTVYSTNGTAVDCVKLGLNEICDTPPDFIFSGINHGTNSSISIIYSGTMGAALEGSIHGIRSIGFSVLDYSPDPDFSTARKFGDDIIRMIINDDILPKGACLNVNFPDVTPESINGIKVCRQAKSSWTEEFERRTDENGKEYYWLTGHFNNHEPDAIDTDDWALKNNYVTVVPVKVDFTDHEIISKLKMLEV